MRRYGPAILLVAMMSGGVTVQAQESAQTPPEPAGETTTQAVAPAAAPASVEYYRYVSERLYLGLYADQTLSGPAKRLLPSGVRLGVLSTQGDASEVRLNDGTTGWVRTSNLTGEEPAKTQLAGAQKQIGQLKNELKDLQGLLAQAKQNRQASAATKDELAKRDAEIQSVKAALVQARAEIERLNAAAAENSAPVAEHEEAADRSALPVHGLAQMGWLVLFGAAMIGVGVAIGYALLQRRLRRRYHGMKL